MVDMDNVMLMYPREGQLQLCDVCIATLFSTVSNPEFSERAGGALDQLSGSLTSTRSIEGDSVAKVDQFFDDEVDDSLSAPIVLRWDMFE